MFGRILLPVFVLSLMSTASFAASADCEVCSVVSADEPVDSLSKAAESAPENMGPSDIKDVPSFCRINAFRDFTYMEKQGYSRDNPWAGGLVPARDRRESVYNSALGDVSGDIDHAGLPEFVPLTSAEIAGCHATIESLKASTAQQGEEESATLTQSAYLCKDLTFTHVAVCSKSLEKLVELTKAHDDINLLDIWAQVFDDPTYFEVMHEVALQNMDLIKNGKIPLHRFFDDLNDAFYSRLKDHEKSIDHTFKLLGVLASDGNNTGGYVPGLNYTTNFSRTITILNLTSVVLDRSSAQKGFLYTYPKEVDSLCDYGKDYHFWMTAFLAREAAKESGNVVAAAAAAFTMNKGYQFMKVDNGRDRRFAFSQNSFSNYNNNMRLDLTQSAAGAWFGATSVKNLGRKKLSRDKFEAGLKEVFKGSKPANPQPSFSFPDGNEPLKIVKTYTAWKSIINPDAAYHYFQKEMGQ